MTLIKRWSLPVLGVGISVALVWWTLKDEDLGSIAGMIANADPLLFFLAIAVATSGYVLRAIRWRYFLEPFVPNTSFRSRYYSVGIGFMATNLLPVRLGEFVRPVTIQRLEPVTFTGAAGSLVVERFLDGVVLVSLLMIVLLSPGFPEVSETFARQIEFVVWLTGAIVVIALVLMAFPNRLVRMFEAVAQKVLPRKFSEPIVGFLEVFLHAFSVLRTPRLLLPAVLWSYAFWCWHAFSFWLGFKAFGIDVGYGAAVVVNSVVGFFVAIPSSPGFFGTFHVGALAGLAPYGVDGSTATAFAYGYHIGGFIPVTLIGLFFLWRLGLSLGGLMSKDADLGEMVMADVESEFPDESSSAS